MLAEETQPARKAASQNHLDSFQPFSENTEQLKMLLDLSVKMHFIRGKKNKNANFIHD